jgi:hypothetical protein
MKHLAKIAGLCLASMLLLGMALTATASAATPVWEQCTTEMTIPTTKYTEHQCLEAKSGSGWQWNEVKGTEKVKSTGTLRLADKKASILGETSLQCGGTDEGSVGPKQFSRVTSITASSCTLIKAGGCEKLIGVAIARNLPWQGELIETEKEVRNVITETASGKPPGWETECETLEGKKKDECTNEGAGKEEITNAENKATSLLLLVLLRFFPRRKADCTLGGKEQGEVVGNVALFAENGWGLRTSP